MRRTSASTQSSRELAGSFGIVVTLRPSRSIAEARDLVEAELARLVEADVDAEELLRGRNMRTAGFYFALEHIGGFGGVADRLNAYNVFQGDPSLLGADVRRFQDVDAATIRAVAKRHIVGRPRVVLSVAGRGSIGLGRARGSTAGTVRAESNGFHAPGPGNPGRLQSGMLLWAFPRRELPTVAGSIVIPGGGGLQAPGQDGVAQLMADMLDEGTSNRTAAQIAIAVEAMGASISVNCGWDGIYIGFRCLATDLGTTLDLAVDILLNPTFPEAEWRRVLGQTLAGLRAERDSAEARAYRTLLKALYGPEHPFRFPLAGSEASVAGVGVDDLKAFHARYLVPGRASVVVAGDIDPETVADELDRRLAGWSGPDAAPPGAARRRASASTSHPPASTKPWASSAGGGKRASAIAGFNARSRPRLRPPADLQPDPRRPVHVAAQREAPRGAGIHLRHPQPVRMPALPRPVLDRRLAPERPSGRGHRGHPPRGPGHPHRPPAYPGRAGQGPPIP